LPVGIRPRPDDRDTLGRHPAAFDRGLAVGLVRCDDVVSHRVRRALQQEQHAQEEPGRPFETRAVDLRAEIVLVEDEALAEELEGRGQRPVGVGRVARLDDVDPFASAGAEHEREGSEPAVDEFPGVRERAFRRGRWRVLPNSDAFDLLKRWIPGTFGANNRHLEARVSQRARFSPYPSVEGNRQVVIDDEDALTRAA
jgi:hypothetical protein